MTKGGLHQAELYARSLGYGKGKAFLEDDYLDWIDKILGITHLLDIEAIETDDINYTNILQYQKNGGNLYTFEFNGHEIYFVPD